jgi:hypothetical protein
MDFHHAVIGVTVVGDHQDEFALEFRPQELGQARGKPAFDLAIQLIAAAELKVADGMPKGFCHSGLQARKVTHLVYRFSDQGQPLNPSSGQ